MNMPKHKGEVYSGYSIEDFDSEWERHKKVAVDTGFKFVKYGHMVFVLTPNTDYESGYAAIHNVCKYAYLPDAPKENKVTQAFEQRVMEFVLAPERSNRNRLIGDLSTYGFFTAGADQVKIIEDILADTKLTYICDQGKKKFREHMGDMLVQKNAVYTLQMTFEGDPYASVSGNIIAGDIQRVVKKLFSSAPNPKVAFVSKDLK